jgi:uncharacterized protein
MPEIDVDASVVALVIVAVVMAIGLLGTLLPFVPGLPLIWAAALGFGLIEGFGSVGSVALIAISIVGLIGIAAGVALPARRAGASGAPRSTLAAGTVGGLVGFFLIPVIGFPVGAVLGVLLAEYNRTQRWAVAWASTKAVIVGFGIGILVQLGAGVIMIAIWVAWVLAK